MQQKKSECNKTATTATKIKTTLALVHPPILHPHHHTNQTQFQTRHEVNSHP